MTAVATTTMTRRNMAFGVKGVGASMYAGRNVIRN
jgi:hypothetical protein